MTCIYPVCPVCSSSACDGFRFRIGSYDSKSENRSSTWFECFVCTTRFPLWTYFDAWKPNVVTEIGEVPSDLELRSGLIHSLVCDVPARDSSDCIRRHIAETTGSDERRPDYPEPVHSG